MTTSAQVEIEDGRIVVTFGLGHPSKVTLDVTAYADILARELLTAAIALRAEGES